MKNSLLKFILTSFITYFLISCINIDPNITIMPEGKVIVINQGNYSEQSGSISLYDENTKQLQNRIYEGANGTSIGAIIISGTVTPSKEAILVCNNPDKIIFLDAKTAKDKGTNITDGLESPRNMVITTDRIYVTNYGKDHIVLPNYMWEFNKSYVAIYDIFTKALIKKVLVGSDAEGLAIYGNRLFVAVKEGVRVLDLSNADFPVLATIRAAAVTGASKHLTFDESYNLWASFPDKGLVQIDPVSNAVLAVVNVPVDSMDGYITTDATGSNILTYYSILDTDFNPLNATIYSVNVKTKTVTTFYEGTYFYGVGVSLATGDIFTAEASFTSNSILKVVGPDGTIRNSATAGVGTCRYLFF